MKRKRAKCIYNVYHDDSKHAHSTVGYSVVFIILHVQWWVNYRRDQTTYGYATRNSVVNALFRSYIRCSFMKIHFRKRSKASEKFIVIDLKCKGEFDFLNEIQIWGDILGTSPNTFMPLSIFCKWNTKKPISALHWAHDRRQCLADSIHFYEDLWLSSMLEKCELFALHIATELFSTIFICQTFLTLCWKPLFELISTNTVDT